MTPKVRRSYDHRIREQVAVAGNADLFPDMDIPRSTARSWVRRGFRKVVSLADNPETEATMRAPAQNHNRGFLQWAIQDLNLKPTD